VNNLRTSLRTNFTDDINIVDINDMSSYFFGFVLIPSFFPVISSMYTEKIFSSVKFTVIYQRKYFVNISVCICQFSGNDNYIKTMILNLGLY
jgi:hypothetical protein